MEKNISVSLIRLEKLKLADLEGIRSAMLESVYDEHTGYGFTNVSGSVDYISGSIVIRTPTFIPQLQTDTWQIVPKEFFLYSEIEFEIDFSLSLLEIFAPVKNTSKVTSHIIPLLGKDVRVSPIIFSPMLVYKNLINNNLLKCVERLVVNNFQHMDGITGRYDMKINDPSLGLDIITKYNEGISKVVLIIIPPNSSDVKLTISKNGNLIIRCDENVLPDVLDQIKNTLFMGKE